MAVDLAILHKEITLILEVTGVMKGHGPLVGGGRKVRERYSRTTKAG